MKTQNIVKVTDISSQPTEATSRVVLTDELVTVIALGNFSADSATIKQRLIDGESIQSAGREYCVV